MKLLISAIAFAAIATTACESSMKTPDIKHNPHPKMRYELTLMIHDAPGPFDSVEGVMQYEVTDKRCSPENPISGTRNPPHAKVPFVLTRTADNVYTGTVYLDMLRDEDYYGLGVCHWHATFASAALKIRRATFNVGIAANEITSQKPTTEYLWKQAYTDPTSDDGSGNSVPLIDAVKLHPERYFSATWNAREQFE